MKNIEGLFERLGYVAIVILTAAALVIGTWAPRNGEAVMNADIARDFLLYDSLAEDPIMLIGPRADYKGLFHGPAWLYLNYPAYVIGQGSPIAMTYYWILLSLIAAGINYWVGMKLFDKVTGFVFASMMFVSTMYYVNEFYNPVGAMFIMPLFIYSAYMYVKKQDVRYMIAQLILAGFVMQFQLAAGIPTILLTVAALTFQIIRTKHYKHFLAFPALLIPLSTFIVYELRYRFPQYTAIVNRFSESYEYVKYSFEQRLSDRYAKFFGPGLGFFEGKYGHFNRYVGAGFFVTLGYLFSKKRFKEPGIYVVGLYYFLGFYALSFIHSGSVLLHYYIPFISIPLLLYASLHRHVHKALFLTLTVGILIINISHLSDRQEELEGKVGTHYRSWTSIQEVMGTVEDAVEDTEIGIFVYAPDSYAYGPKYAAVYMQRTFNTNVAINEKKPETYLIYEEAPEEFPWLNGEYWRTDLIDIDVEPVMSVKTKAGYTIEKYELPQEEIEKPIDPLALDWISQR